MILKKNRKIIFLLFIIILLFSSSKCSNDNQYIEKNTTSILTVEDIEEQHELLSIESEDSLLPNITILDININKKDDLQKIANDMYATANLIEKDLTNNSIPFENIFVNAFGLFNSYFIFDYNNGIFYVPIHYDDMKYVLKEWGSESIDSLIAISEARDFLLKNGYIYKNSNGEYKKDMFSSIDECFTCFINEGVLKKYFIEDSIPIKYLDGKLELSPSSLVDKTRKSFWIENWLIVNDFDEFTDNPSNKISQNVSIKNNLGNVWFNIRKRDGKKEIYLSFSNNIELDNVIPVIYRIDSNSLVNLNWSSSTNSHGAFFPKNTDSFINDLKKGSVIIFKMKDKYGKNLEFKFDLIYINKALQDSKLI